EKKRLEEELRIAHEIQMSLLPQGPLLMPGLSVTALCVPAREVGGDYYDFLPLDRHRVGVLIADVSGKGTSAALYMAELKGLMLSLSEIRSSPRALLVAANRIIRQHLAEETIRLMPGDLYCFFTDGISEAMNTRDDCFGEARLGQLVQAHAHLPSDQLRERVLREIAAFVGDAPQHDDMTMILLKVDEVGAAVA